MHKKQDSFVCNLVSDRRHIAIPAASLVLINDANHIGMVRHARLVSFQKQLLKGPKNASMRLCSQRRSSALAS